MKLNAGHSIIQNWEIMSKLLKKASKNRNFQDQQLCKNPVCAPIKTLAQQNLQSKKERSMQHKYLSVNTF